MDSVELITVKSMEGITNDFSKSLFLMPTSFVQLEENCQNKNFPLLWKAATAHNLQQVQQLLAENDFSYDICSTLMDGNSLLVYVISMSYFLMTKALLEHPKLDLNKALNQTNKGGRPLIMVAIFVGSSEIVKLLLQYPELDLNVRDLRRKTPIHLAASIGSLEILRALLDRKELDPNSKDAEGRIPLHEAAARGHVKSVALLLSFTPDKNIGDAHGMTVMRYAATGDGAGKPEVVSFLMKDPDIQIDVKDLIGETPLQAAAILGLENVVNVLLRSEYIDVNNKNNHGMSVFNSAITGGNQNVVAALLLHPSLVHDSKTLTNAIAHAPKAVEKLFDTCYKIRTGHHGTETLEFNFKQSGLLHETKTVTLVLREIINNRRRDLIRHPLIATLMDCKWTKYQLFFLLNFFFYLLFFLCLVFFLALVRFPESYPGNDLAFRIVVGILSSLRLVMEAVQFFNLKIAYFQDPSNWAELFIFSSAFILIASMHTHPPIWQIELGAMSVFVAAVNLVVFLRNLSYFRFGLYVVMLIEVSATFMVVLPLLVLLLLAFSLGMYFALDENFGYLLNALLQFLFGDQGLYDLIWTKTDMFSLRVLSILFFLIMSLLLLNFLVGLAVGDIEGIKKSAEITLFSIRAETVYIFDSMPRLRKNLPAIYLIEKDKKSKTKEFFEKLGFNFGDKYFIRMSQDVQESDPVVGEIQQLEQNISTKIQELEANFEDRISKEMAEMKKAIHDIKKLLESRPVS